MNRILKETRNPLDIAEKLEIPVSKARKMVAECTDTLPGWGRLEVQKHLISRRHIHFDWPREHTLRLEYYRKRHDQGEVNMCQGRDGPYVLQYAMPNIKPVPRETYFYVDRGY